MINRFQLLRNIGQFDSVNSAADIPLARLTVVYSENGRGKTTLAAVLRSLGTGDPIPIAERKRLTAQHPPHVVLECSGGPPPAIFENNAWNRTLGDIVVFDDFFIDQNVHSGLAVEAHHRQNLHELILGAQAVALNQRLQALVAQIEVHNTALRTKAGAIPAADRGPFSVDDFCALAAQPDIDQAIKEAERALAAAREQDAIRTTPPFDFLNLPVFDLAGIEPILQQDLPALDTATLARVQTHLAGLGQDGEAWVADGMRRIPQEASSLATGKCPFCAQDLQGSPIIDHYRAYFRDAYTALKRTVSDTLGALNRTHGGDVPVGFERAVRVIVERRQFWLQFSEVTEVTLDTAAIVRDWRAAREAIIAQLAAKQTAPLERLELSDETRARVATFHAHQGAIATLNQRLRDANQAINVAQVIVLSHNKPFLCRLWEGSDSTLRAALEVIRGSSGSTVREWDVGQDCITEHDRRHTRLRDYRDSGSGDRREVARSIRPHLEAFLRVACPEHFAAETRLGTFRNACRQRLGTPQQILDSGPTQELNELVEYANRFHHDTNPAWETETINDGELRGFVDRALMFARR